MTDIGDLMNRICHSVLVNGEIVVGGSCEGGEPTAVVAQRVTEEGLDVYVGSNLTFAYEKKVTCDEYALIVKSLGLKACQLCLAPLATVVDIRSRCRK